MASIGAEFKRRSIVSVAVAYAIVGMLLINVAEDFAKLCIANL